MFLLCALLFFLSLGFPCAPYKILPNLGHIIIYSTAGYVHVIYMGAFDPHVIYIIYILIYIIYILHEGQILLLVSHCSLASHC